MLELSRKSNLVVTPGLTRTPQQRLWDFYLDICKANMSRISVLHVVLNDQYMKEVLNCLDQPCLVREELSLGQMWARFQRRYHAFPSAFSVGPTPRLRHLSLEHFDNISWTLPLFTSLTTLDISSSFTGGPHLVEFFEMLRRTLSLERLVVQGNVEQKQTIAMTSFQHADLPSPIVSLSKLKELSISEREEIAMPLLFGLSFPVTARLHAMVTCSEDTACLDLLKHLKRHLVEGHARPYLPAMKMDIRGDSQLQIRWYTDPAKADDPSFLQFCDHLDQDPHAHACIYTYIKSSNGILPKELIEAATSDGREVTKLCLLYECRPPCKKVFADVLDTCANSLPNVEELSIYGLPGRRTFQALDGTGKAPDTLPSLPRLRVLSVGGPWEEEDEGEGTRGESWLKLMIRDTLRSRGLAGYPLHRFMIGYDISCPPAYVEELRCYA